MADIRTLTEAWEGHTGLEVETFLKAQIGDKFGDFRTTQPDEHNFIHLLCFSTEDDAHAWDEDPQGSASLVLKDITIPISTASVDSYVLSLSTSRSTSIQYLVKDGDSFPVPLRLNATHIVAATSSQEAMSGNGTLIVERSSDGTSWTQTHTQTMAASSESTGFPLELDLKGMLEEGSLNYIRLRATFPYTDIEGVEKTMGSTPVILQVQSVSLQVEMSTPWHEPIVNQQSMNLTYVVRGSIERTVHLKVTGSAGTYETAQSIMPAQTQVTFPIVEVSAYGLLTHGVKTCEAWLTAGDADTGELESEHLTTRLMVVQSSAGEEVYMQPRLLISEMKSEVENFVQTRLLSYAVYSPALNAEGTIVNNGPAIPTTLMLTNSASSIISVQQNTYASMLVTPQPGQRYGLDMTVEIEQDGDILASFLHATREEGGVQKDFLLESTGSGSIYLRVDNTGGFQPTAGSTFLLNPKQRNNDEANPKTILNAKANNTVVESEWQNFRLGYEDGYIKDENGESCLRIPAGRKLYIRYNPLGLLYRSPNASITMEFDVAIRNVTNEDDPILQLAEQVSGVWRGLRVLPMTGFFTTESWDSDEESDFRWSEDERTHIAVNIVNAVYPNAHGDALVTAEKESQSRGSMPLVRIFINGIIKRELVYTPSVTEFCTGAMSNGGFVIGQDGADIDIYGMRFFEGVALDAANVQQDWYSTIPDSEKKRRLKAENNIIDPNTGLISLDYIAGRGNIPGIKRNWLIWHGNEPYHDNAHKNETGWIEWARYDNDGNYLPELSGTFCKETKSVPQKSQGTTAKTYYFHNIQWDGGKAKGIITIDITMLHSSITAEWDANYEWLDDDEQPTGEVGAWMLKGGYLGKNFPLPTESALPYHGTPTTVTVPDGWIDGNGKYRGVGVQVAEGIPMAQKTVNKINYASSMQSHLIGINWLYNELHTRICGKNTMQAAVSGAVVAKHTEPFLFFTQAEGAQRAVFRGPCAWGAGKMDKPSWGYVKSAHPDFCMIEGADNDKQLTDMRVPWDDTSHGSAPAKVFYDPDEEAWYYRVKGGDAEKCIDFDAGKTDEIDGAEYPKEKIVGYIRNAWNFLYLHAPRIRHYNGTLSDFTLDAELAQRTITSETSAEERERIEQAQARVNTANKYWCHIEGVSATGDYLLKRYDFADGAWVDAGLWDDDFNTYGRIDVRYGLLSSMREYVGDDNDPYHGALRQAWESLTESERNQDSVVNTAVVTAIVEDARKHIGNYFKVSSLKFHYCFQNHFIAGTDNCSKNTYYVLDPVTHLFELHQDDVDTTLATDNSGLQSKPYYIDRMHPYGGINAKRVAMTGDVDNANILYEGYYNVLFDLCELMYEPTGELQAMMRTIFSEMASLTGGIDRVESQSMSGVWKTLNRYLFNIQRYFPATVFNEAARIRYELPELIGFLSDIRAVHPIKQSLGDQLEAEIQFMKRRLVYMASYAAFGEFAPTGIRSGLTGLSEATESFGMQKFALPGSSSPSAYTFNLVPHQWIYPTGGRETNNLIDPHVRVAPGDTFVLDINPGQASDLGVNVFGLNYYRELGNVGDMVANNGQANFTLNGRRLVKFEAVPTVFYTDEQLPAFRVNNIIIGSATRLKEFNVRGAVIGTGTLNLSALTLLENADLRSTGISQVRLPSTSTLTTLHLPATLTQLSLTAQSNLSVLSVQGAANLTRLAMTGCPLVMGNTAMLLVDQMRREEAVATDIQLNGMAWQGVMLALLRYLVETGDRGVCQLTGSIAMSTTVQQFPSYSMVATLIERYGDIRSQENPLYIDYPTQPIQQSGIGIGGRKYVIPTWLGQLPAEWKPSALHPDAGLWLTVESGNNVLAAQHTDAAGKTVWTPAVTWQLAGEGDSAYAEFKDMYSPVLTLKQLYSGAKITVRVTVRTATTTLAYEKTIGLWNRLPEVGDFAWTDGTFDSEDDQSKLLAGVVVMREPLQYTHQDSGEVIDNTEYNAIADTEEKAAYTVTKARLWVLATANASVPASTFGGTGGSADIPSCVNAGNNNEQQSMANAWGLYPSTYFGFVESKDNNIYTDELMKIAQATLVAASPVEGGNYTLNTDIFDVPALPNLYTDFNISPSTYQDETNYSPAIGRVDNTEGTGRVSNQPVGDGTGYKQRTATGTEAVEDFSTLRSNQQLMAHANVILQGLIRELGIPQDAFPQDGSVDMQTGIPLTRQGQADMTLLIQRYFSARLQAAAGNPVDPSEAPLNIHIAETSNGSYSTLAIVRQMMFAAPRVCSVWSPADIANSGITEATLNPQYRRGKWMLPSNGLLARIFNFLYNSSCTTDAETGVRSRATSAAATRANHAEIGEVGPGNITVVHESQLPLFSNVMERSNGRRNIALSTGSTHWSCTENYRFYARYVYFLNGNTYNSLKYYSHTVRPVSAFTFDSEES